SVQESIEQSHDKDGIIWAKAIAPFHVHVCALDPKDAAVMGLAESLERELAGRGIDVLVDDRDERPGVKFKDADLLGMPVRVVIGNAFVKEGLVEVRSRKTRQESRVPKDKVVDAIRAIQAAEARR